ncbi:MAG: primase protein [Candidatus Amesbacteria bacterium GW2011_GWB1_47_26]|uniref:DNA primase n=1 Tax=Candidatus Amesbacteria bacterium GW2011_GWC2_45_19 TaxID=1618366 RepID=A0A0G1M283_9BACT|nr:MAG: primase protein [Candidatus Amesbacteria bacterium GW2011_GWC2_45_19]KKU38214.1 MAG: primase protein [Candidatus Amesbacteria bacterium GW2011_GWA1_46_35]KKU74265.1 MAG: primase protein [Candidatus Amesbacteria bacterium GW2011_GWB1_47_26]KKU79552.1 MAG: primase protein [Candidatus Amesbacteria bacterium GW2011_GWA2_47_70]
MDQVEEIKSKVDMVELVQEYVPLKRAGRNFKGLCPFHGEKTPSFMVNPELQIFKCFGCNLGGDAYTFLQKIEGMEFGEALQHLADRVGVKLVSYRPTQGEQMKEKLVGINALTGQVYHWLLTEQKTGKEALEYLKQRGLSDEVIKKFNIGFAPDNWDFLFKFLVGKKKYTLDDLTRAGLAVKNYDRFRNRIMFPLTNGRGQIVGYAGRVLPAASAEATASQGGKYVNTPETEIYHKSELLYGLDITRAEIKNAGWAVVVEGEIDAIASWQAGVRNVVAIKGSALTEKQVELLRRICDTIVLALDTDIAGDAAARRGISIADSVGLMVKVINSKSEILNPKHFKDPGDWAVEDPDGWKKAVREAIPVYDFYLQSAVERYGLEVAGKKKIGQELLPVWANISDEIVKAHYIKLLAKTLGVEEEDVRAQMGKVLRAKGQGLSEPSTQHLAPSTRREILEEYVIELALKGGKTGELPEMKTDFWGRVAEELVKNGDPRKLPEELREKTQILLLKEGEFEEKGWATALRELEEIEVREEIKGLSNEGDENQLRGLIKRLSELTKDK